MNIIPINLKMNLCKLLLTVLVGILTSIQYALPAPIFPLEMKRRALEQISIGIAMSAYSIGTILGCILPTDRIY